MTSHIKIQIRQKLLQISPVILQKIAEDLACVKFPERFNRQILRRPGRNEEDQTTKGWPDAFVSTGVNEVDGIEATRQATRWDQHLQNDLKHAKDPNYRKLSGYVFVGGYPDNAPSAKEIDNWIDLFAKEGINRKKINILVGSDLVNELAKPDYAVLRLNHLGIATSPKWFHLLGNIPVKNGPADLFQPRQSEYDKRIVQAPEIIDEVVRDVISNDFSIVQGYGAAGKTTLSELIARHDKIAPNAVWYIDLAQMNGADGTFSFITEMTSLAAPMSLFIIDNVHIDNYIGDQIFDYWKKHLQALRVRLLFLRRNIYWKRNQAITAYHVHELRAGVAEMQAVINRLGTRDGYVINTIPLTAMNTWARIFGGSDRPDEIAVDLIAFTAAAARRINKIARGDFRLSIMDAFQAVNERYLIPLQRSDELENLLYLAALSDFEISLTNEQLLHPVNGLADAINKLGIVVQDEIGLEKRKNYRLVHAGVGPLILGASGYNPKLHDIRLEIVRKNPILGPRIIQAMKRADPENNLQHEFDQAVISALKSQNWPNTAQNFYELEGLGRHALRKKIYSIQEIDTLIVDSKIILRLFDNAPSLSAINYFLARAKQIGLIRSILALNEVLASDINFLNTLCISSPSNVVTLIRSAPKGNDILKAIDGQSWKEGQATVSAERVSLTISSCRFFERQLRPELAHTLAIQHCALADSKLWDCFDLSYLSHMIRIGRPDYMMSKQLIQTLVSSGWIYTTFNIGINGHLCGALLSLANYLDPSLRHLILTPELESRIFVELSRPSEARKKGMRRAICMFGGFDALGGHLSEVPVIDWSVDPVAEQALNEVAHSDTTGDVGTYELQLWLGLRALHAYGQGPTAIHQMRGESFLTRLKRVQPPTDQAEVIQLNLIQWLEQIKDADWTL